MEASQLAALSSLEVLDLTRNNIANLAAGTFESLVNLKELRLGVNMIRQVSPRCYSGFFSGYVLKYDLTHVKSVYFLKYIQEKMGNELSALSHYGLAPKARFPFFYRIYFRK